MLEMMISLSILLISMSATLSAVNAACRIFYNQRQLTQAVAIGESVTEGLLMMDNTDDALAYGEHIIYFDRTGLELDDDNNSYYQTNWSITPYEEVAGIREISVTVTWEDQYRSHQLDWTTFRN